MAIIFALVARGTVVLSEFSATSTNASSIAKQILEKLPGNDSDSHMSYSQDRYIFHVKRTDGLTVLCMADETAGSKLLLSLISSILHDLALVFEFLRFLLRSYINSGGFDCCFNRKMLIIFWEQFGDVRFMSLMILLWCCGREYSVCVFGWYSSEVCENIWPSYSFSSSLFHEWWIFKSSESTDGVLFQWS